MKYSHACMKFFMLLYRSCEKGQKEGCSEIALKLVSHRWDTSYKELLRLVDVPMLGERRLHLKLAHMYKVVHGLCYFPEDVKFSRRTQLILTDLPEPTPFIVHLPVRTTISYHSFVPSSIRAWNSLEESQTCAVSLHSFKHMLRT